MVRNKGYNCSLELAQNIDRLYPSNYFDYLLCIAVIHHLPTEEERIITVIKCITLLKKDGHALFTTWAFEQSYTDDCGTLFTTSKPRTFPNTGDNIVSWNKNKINDDTKDTIQINHKNKKAVADRFYYIYTYDNWCLLWENVKSRLLLSHNYNINVKISYEEQNWVANVSYRH
jgi:2-polyprenyl-3-methyl-5-hydroxy-6-metoxy-1,4-benzoquinol methylase